MGLVICMFNGVLWLAFISDLSCYTSNCPGLLCFSYLSIRLIKANLTG